MNTLTRHSDRALVSAAAELERADQLSRSNDSALREQAPRHLELSDGLVELTQVWRKVEIEALGNAGLASSVQEVQA